MCTTKFFDGSRGELLPILTRGGEMGYEEQGNTIHVENRRGRGARKGRGEGRNVDGISNRVG